MNAPTTKRLNWKGKFAIAVMLWCWVMLNSANNLERQSRENADFIRELQHGSVEQAARNLRQ